MSSVDHGFNDQQYQLFFYPLGLAVGEERDNPTLPVNAEVINRPRSASNATQDVADIRGSMTKSVTDLFVDIGFVDDVRIPPHVSGTNGIMQYANLNFVVTGWPVSAEELAFPFDCRSPGWSKV